MPPPRHLAALAAAALLASQGGLAAAQAQGEPPAAGDQAKPAPEPAPSPGVAPPAPEPEPGPAPAPAETAPTPDQVFSGTPTAEALREESEEHSWFDQGHAYLGRLFFDPVFRFDRFFADRSELTPERSRSYARLRLSLWLRQDGRPAEAVDFYANLHLPGVNRVLDRFRLVLASEAGSALSGILPESGTIAPFTRRETGPPNAELRFGAFQGLRTSVDLGAGLFARIPPGGFVRARLRLAIPVGDLFLSRLAFQTFFRTDMRLGVRSDGALERPFGPSWLLHLGGSAQAAQRRTDGVDYGAELVLAHAFAPTVAAAVGTDAGGSSQHHEAFDKYRVYVRGRHDVLRQWLFLEVEPEVGWPWTRERGRYRAYAVTFRLEIQFSGERASEGQERPSSK